MDHFRVLSGFAASFPPLQIPSWKDAVKEQLNKRLVHFTASRWRKTPDFEMSDYAQHFDHLNKLISDFEKALPANLRAEFDQKLQTYEHRDRKLS